MLSATAAAVYAPLRWLDGPWVWRLGNPDPVLRAPERDCPEVSRAELARRYPEADLSEAEAMLAG